MKTTRPAKLMTKGPVFGKDAGSLKAQAAAKKSRKIPRG